MPLQVGLLDVLRDPWLTEEARAVAAGRLLGMARETAFPELACRALEYALVQETDATLAGDPGFGDPVDARLYDMLRRGEDTCRRCLRPLPDERTLEVWRLEFEAGPWDRSLRTAAS